MSPEAQKELNRLEDSPAPRGAAYWQRRALAAEKRVRELVLELAEIREERRTADIPGEDN